VLFRESGIEPGDPLQDLDWQRFPLKAMIKLGWFPKALKLGSPVRDAIQDLIRRAGGPDVSGVALFRKNDHARANAKADAYALKAWCWQVLAKANEERPAAPYKPGTVTPSFLRQIARLSWSEEGPRLAKEFLEKHGIPLVVVPHLPKTYLDGAALKLADGTPVVALTLRYDRVDNFWFCLLHELAHVGRHIETSGDTAFVDDLTLRDVTGGHEDPKELQADEWAEEALVPSKIWETSSVRENPTAMAVISLANALQIHPAIVAGKIRHEQRNFRLLSQFVGIGEVRRQFGLTA
jgi:HTH-type transcriptional regulator/antitoxin HigA